MPTIKFSPSGKSLEVQKNTSIYHAALTAGLPIASSCSGDFTCGKCVVQILKGDDAVSKKTEKESTLIAREKNPPNDRISCRCYIQGDCEVTTRYW